MTELLYMQDFNVESCGATIESVSANEDGRTDIMLDKTCFYARGGGQDWDKGQISKDGALFSVEEVRLDESGQVHHVGIVSAGTFTPGDAVSGTVDHGRRAINTRLHSAGHVIDMAVDRLGLDWLATKGQHYPELSAVEYYGTWEPERAETLRAEIEKRANEFIAQGTENTLQFMPVEEMHTVCRHVPENIPKNKPGRVVMYGEHFGIPCGGTHVKNLKEIGVVKIIKLKEKKGVIRLSYGVEGINV
jgi:Ser-tRNA(Ala) deacylase AlaX